MFKFSICSIILIILFFTVGVIAQTEKGEFDNDERIGDYSSCVFLMDIENQSGSGSYTFSLQQNNPNPFNPATRIVYSLAEERHVIISVIDSKNEKICFLTDEVQPAGEYSIIWYGVDENAYAVKSGVYYCRLEAGDFIETQKMILRR